MEKKTTLKDLCSFPGSRALARIHPHPDHAGAAVVTLQRRQKKRFVAAAWFTAAGTTRAIRRFAISMLSARPCIFRSGSAGSIANGAKL